MALIRRFIAVALATLVATGIAACGGGTDADVPPPPSLALAQHSGQVLHAVAASSVPSAAQAGPVTPDEVMNWAEASFPAFFPAATHRTGTLGDYVAFRYYPTTQNWLAISLEPEGWTAYVYGSMTNWAVVYEGLIDDYACAIRGGAACQSAGTTPVLLYSRVGIALSSTPSWTRTTATVSISDTAGGHVAWTAASDKSWLTVTTSGNTGSSAVSSMSISANVSTLPTDQVSIATVTLTPTTPGVVSPEKLVIGLWKGSSTPTQAVKVTGQYKMVIADPVRPYVYVHTKGSSIEVFNLYKQQLEATISDVGGVMGAMTVSPDGSTLYVLDTANRAVVPIDLKTRAVKPALNLAYIATAFTGLTYARPNGIGMLVLGDGSIYTAAPWSLVADAFPYSGPFPSVAVSPDNTRIVYTDSGGATLYSLAISSNTLARSYVTGIGLPNGKDAAFSRDGSKFYTASGRPYECDSWGAVDGSAFGVLPAEAYPVSVEVGSDGRVYCGIQPASSTDPDIWVYSASGAFIKGLHVVLATVSNVAELIDRQFVVGGDGLMGAALIDDWYYETDWGITLVPIGP